jgi:5-deoxy-glucuronate isomerase
LSEHAEAFVSTSDLSKSHVVFRRTNAQKGRHISVTPANSATRHLSYGRIILDRDVPSVTFETGVEEVGLVCFRGAASVSVAGQRFALTRYDTLYVPRDEHVQVATESEADIAELRAPVDNRYPLQFIPYADVLANPGLHFKAGGPGCARTLNMLLAKNVQAGRLMAGVTWSDPGNWTSWPPHEHADLAEELYVYYDLPPEAFGIQMVYTDKMEPERIEMVRDGDVVIMPKGFHPNVSIPGYPISFLWVMAADREVEDRKFGVVNVHPDFAQAPSGLEKGR